WLISPGINMNAQTNEYLNFKSAQHHLDSPNNKLEVFVSTNFNGSNVLAATWVPITASLASQSNAWYEFVDSGLINLSSYTGTLYVAFKVTGSGTDTTLDGAYQIDDFKIIASK
ncbi:MAG TPA: choice-of-anchor J domain-containing protein, partial [Mariniflexile sp.]|nr:choice-of-anchor J domain-containing protein [Mariniflexile sp.]